MVEPIKKYMIPNFVQTEKENIQISDSVEQSSGVRQGCSLSPYYLFNIFINNVDCEGSAQAPTVKGMSIPRLLFADDITINH
jgi:hypothetical protein